jgi:hypothetical protein
MGRLRKKAAGKARESCGMRRTFSYAAMTKDEEQRSIRLFYEAVRRHRYFNDMHGLKDPVYGCVLTH